MASNPLYNSSLVNLYRSIGTQMGFSPAFQNASAAQGISESSLNPNAVGDSGASFGLHQWNRKASPERYQALLNVSKQMGLPPTDPRVQITHWYNENQANKGITDPRAANDAALASERPAGWKPGDPTGVPSYNNRLGDTMALLRLANGQPNPQDPRSFQATGTDEQANAGTPINASDQQPEGERPLNNIGSTLANIGSIVSGLGGNRNAALTLGTANAANDLQRAEAARVSEAQPKLVGFNADKTKMIFQQEGKLFAKDTPAGFGGPEVPTSAKEYQYAVQNGYQGTYDEFRNNTPQADDESLKIAGLDWATNGNPQALKDIPQNLRPKAMQLAKQQIEADTGQAFDPVDLVLRRGDYKTLQAESSKFGQMLAPTQAAHDRLQEDIKIAKERVADLPSELNSSNLPFNKFMQMTAEQLQQQGFDKLAKARESIYNVERGYSSVQANGLRSGDTVAAQKRAEGLINSAMTADTLLGQSDKEGKRAGGLLDFMGESSTRILNSVKGGQETLRKEWKTRARNFGSGVQQNEDNVVSDIDKRIKPPSISNTPASSSPTISREDALAEARRRGLIK